MKKVHVCVKYPIANNFNIENCGISTCKAKVLCLRVVYSGSGRDSLATKNVAKNDKISLNCPLKQGTMLVVSKQQILTIKICSKHF